MYAPGDWRREALLAWARTLPSWAGDALRAGARRRAEARDGGDSGDERGEAARVRRLVLRAAELLDARVGTLRAALDVVLAAMQGAGIGADEARSMLARDGKKK